MGFEIVKWGSKWSGCLLGLAGVYFGRMLPGLRDKGFRDEKLYPLEAHGGL